MANKVGIGIEAQLDTSAVEQRINAFGQRVAQANKVQFTPISVKALDDLETARKRFEQLLKVHGELNRRVKATGQSGMSPWDLDFESMFPGGRARAHQMRRVMEYTFGQPMGPSHGGPTPGSGGGFGGMAGRVAQAGLRAAGPAGGVAANALGTGMSAGFGAGLMGLMGGMLALGVGKIVSAATEKIGQAEDNNVALDRLKRTLGDVNVSFNALKAVVHGSADSLKITYSEAGQLATQFAKLGNVSNDQYKTIKDELGIGVGMSRAFGLDPSQGVGIMGQMRGLGITSNTQESRRFALLIGETIGKSGAFAKADEVMESIAGYAAMQTRAGMGAANVAGYAGMFSGLAGSGIPGLDPAGAGALLGRINSSLAAGGAKGEASQFFTAMVGQRMGLDPFQTQILREGGAFATNDEAFGPGSVASRFGMRGPGGGKTFLQGSLEMLRQQYGGNKGLLAQATANHLGVNMRQAMALLSVDPRQMGELQGMANLGELSGTGIGNLVKARYGTASDRQALAAQYLGRRGRDAISADDRNALNAAVGDDDKLRDVLTQIASKYDQERTMGSDIRDSKAALDNIKTNMADKLVPYMNEMRHGIMYMAGVKDGKSPKDIMEAVLRAESKDREREIRGDYDGRIAATAAGPNALRAERELILNDLRKNYNAMSDADRSAKQKRVQQLSDELAAAEESARKGVLDLTERKKKALQEEVDALEKKVKEMREAPAAGSVPEVTGSIPSSGGGRGFSNPPAVSSSAAAAPGDYDALFVKYGKEHGVDPALLKAIAMKESGMRPGVVSGLNANGTQDYGLMQHNSRYLSSRGLSEDWSNPERSIEEAAKLLASNIQRSGSVRSGVRMYNGSGPGAEAYADDVMARWGRTKIDPLAVGGNTPLPSGAAGGIFSSSLRVTTDDITVRVVDANGVPMQAPQTITTRISPAKPFGASTN